MSETRSASTKQTISKASGSQLARTSHARTAKIRRTREVIERVEVEHAAEAGELPVVTTAEQRVIKATTMERGKQLGDDALPQEEVISSSRKQPGRTAKTSSQTATDIPIEGGSGLSVRVSEPAHEEAGHNGAPFMSTQDYLEEAEELLSHPLDPTPMDTQPEVAAPGGPSATEQEEADAGILTEQAPEEAAAAGERLAEHIEPGPRNATHSDSERQGADLAAHPSESGLVGRVAQVGRQIVRSLLHPNEQGHEEAPAAAAELEALGMQGGSAGAVTDASQEYHVEEPDQSASEAEEPVEAPSRGRGRPKKTNTTQAQAADTSTEAAAGGSGSASAKRGRGGITKLKPYTPAKMAAMQDTPQQVQPVEEVLAVGEEEAAPPEEAAPAPATPPAKRGRPVAPKRSPNTKGRSQAATEQASVEPAGKNPEPKKGRGRPSKAAEVFEASKPDGSAKRSREETAKPAEPLAEGSKSRKSQKTEAAPAGSLEGQHAGQGQSGPRTPARAATKLIPMQSSPRNPSKAPVKAPAAKAPPRKPASRAAVKGPSAQSRGPQKGPARKAASSRRKERPESFKIYIARVLKEIHPEASLSQKAVSVLDSFTKDMHDRIASEAGDLCRRHGRSTLSSREIDAAIRFLLPGELFNHAVAEGRKAVTRALSKND